MRSALACALVLAVLFVVKLDNYLLFHSIVEFACVVVAFGLFIVAFHTRGMADNHCLFFLGVAYLSVGTLDAVHALAYSGMGVFPDRGPNTPTQLWIAARYVESISLLAAPAFLNRKLLTSRAFPVCVAVTALLIWAIFSGWFPDCYVPGSGLTPFKIGSEYLICLALAGSGLVLYVRRRAFERAVVHLVIAAIGITILAELAFTVYVDIYGLANFLGHCLKLLSFYLLYRAIIETGLSQPMRLIFRQLHERDAEKDRLIGELHEALAEVKRLSGLLPICANCKKVRDDDGYWHEVESYIGARTDADFSHGICPQCMSILYPKAPPESGA